MKHRLFYTLVLIAVALTIPTIAGAGSIKIWPDQLKPISPNNPYQQFVAWVTNNAFYAPLTLPLGVTIVKITYYHLGESSQASTSLGLWRARFGSNAELIGTQSSTDSTTAIIPVDVPITGDSTITAGYRYFVEVFANSASYIYGVKITYQK